jgi:hypothetical protein
LIDLILSFARGYPTSSMLPFDDLTIAALAIAALVLLAVTLVRQANLSG